MEKRCCETFGCYDTNAKILESCLETHGGKEHDCKNHRVDSSRCSETTQGVLATSSFCTRHCAHAKVSGTTTCCTLCSSAKREDLHDPTFSCFHENDNCITHLYHKNITRTSTHKRTLKYYEYLTRASRSIIGTCM